MDGLDYIISLRPNAYDWRQQAIASMEHLRKAGLFECMIWVTPANGITLAPLSSHIEQIRPRFGSLIYAVSSFEVVEGLPFTYKLWQGDAPGVSITRGSFVRTPFGRDSWVQPQHLPWLPLEEPFICTPDPVSVEFSNPSTSESVQPQVLVLCAQPLPALSGIAGAYCK